MNELLGDCYNHLVIQAVIEIKRIFILISLYQQVIAKKKKKVIIFAGIYM